MGRTGKWGRGVAAVALLLAAAMAAAAGPPAERKPAGIGDIYLSFGGYLASGDYASDRATTAYPALLVKNHLEPSAGRSVQLIDLGKDEGSQDTVAKFIGDYRTNPNSTSTMAQVIKALRDAKTQGKRVSPVTIELGGEDVFNALQEGPEAISNALELLRDQLAFILDEVTDAVTDADGRRTGDIVLLTYYNALGGTDDGPAVGAVTDQMNALIRKMARTRGLGVADVDKAFAGKELDLLDRFAPTDEGHQLIAAEIMKATGYTLPATGN